MHSDIYDAAREAAVNSAIDKVWPFGLQSHSKAKLHRFIDAFLSKALEGADEKLAEIARRLACRSMALAVDSTNDTAYLRDSAQRANADLSELGKFAVALSAKLKAQKAAHAKMVRDEANTWADYIGDPMRRLADKIEGGE